MPVVRKQIIYIWAPNIFDFRGGLQVFLMDVVKGLSLTNTNATKAIFIKHDQPKNLDPSFTYLKKLKFYFYGLYPLTIRTFVFAINLLFFGLWQRPNFIVVGHLHFTRAAYWIKKIAGIPYWVNVYGLDAWNIENPALQKALHAADRIISISGYTRDRLIKEQNLDPDKISILPCTFDDSQFQIAPKPAYLLEKYGLKPEQPIILTVSRLAGMERYKGYDQILEAMPKIRQALPNAHYMIVGKGDDRPRIEQLIAQKGLEDCVTLAGFVPDEQLCDYYNLCDVFAMPSKREGFGIVYLEALACGKPVLGGNQDGAIDALCHGELGALVNPDDADEIGKTLIQILQGDYPNPLMYQPDTLRQKVIDTFGFERFKQTLAELMKNSPIGADL